MATTRHYVAVANGEFFVCSTPEAAHATVTAHGLAEALREHNYGAHFYYSCDCNDPASHCSVERS